MTIQDREFAKNRIEYLLKISNFALDKHDKEALELAIKALSQEPIDDKCHYCEHNFTPYKGNTGEFTEREPCDDAVSREMALKECHDIVVEGERYRVIQEETLLALPPVTQKLDEQAYNKGFEDCKQAVLDMATTIQTDDFSGNEVIEVVDADDIKSLPSVTQKSGKWILLDECANSGYYCSECHKKLVKEGWSNTVKKINFCPNCGSAMKGE